MDITANEIVTALRATTAKNNSEINVVNIMAALKNVKSTTFATLTQASKIATSAKHKAENLFKITVQNVTLNNGGSSLYNNAVNKELNASQQDIDEAFTALASHYEQINGSYSVCALKSDTNKHYLRAIVNKAIEVIYFDANTSEIVSKEHVAEYLTASAKSKMLDRPIVNTIKHADITHSVTVRNFSLKNIYSLNINKKKLVCVS